MVHTQAFTVRLLLFRQCVGKMGWAAKRKDSHAAQAKGKTRTQKRRHGEEGQVAWANGKGQYCKVRVQEGCALVEILSVTADGKLVRHPQHPPWASVVMNRGAGLLRNLASTLMHSRGHHLPRHR